MANLKFLSFFKEYRLVISIPTLTGIFALFWMIHDNTKNSTIENLKSIIEKDKQEINDLSTKFDTARKSSADNIYTLLVNRTRAYEEQIKELNKEVEQWKARGEYNSEKVIYYQKERLKYQTRLNVLGDLSIDLKKETENLLGPNLTFTEVVPFIFSKLPNENNSTDDSIFQRTFSYYLLKCPPEVYYEWIKSYDSLGKALLTFFSGTHSPLYYSFDNIDLRTASFNNADLRGADLSKVNIDRTTRFPKGVKISTK